MNLANTITILRLTAIIPFVYFLLRENYTVSLIFFVFAVISDALDGYFARKLRQKTKLGSFLDPLADKILIFSGNIILIYHSIIPDWYFILFMAKELSMLAGSIILQRSKIEWEISPNVFGKIALFTQVLVIFEGVIQMGFADIGRILKISVMICSFFILFSWLFYITYFAKMIKLEKD